MRIAICAIKPATINRNQVESVPLKNGRFTPREQVFARVAAETGSKPYAAWRAGYAGPRNEAPRVASRPEVAREIHRLQMARLMDTALPLAVDHVQKTLADATLTARDRTAVAKLAFDESRKEVAALTAEQTETDDLTPDQIRRLHDLLGEVIDVTPEADPAPDLGGVFD